MSENKEHKYSMIIETANKIGVIGLLSIFLLFFFSEYKKSMDKNSDLIDKTLKEISINSIKANQQNEELNKKMDIHKDILNQINKNTNEILLNIHTKPNPNIRS